MILIHDRIEGNQDIRENTCLLGEIVGRVKVSPGISLRVQGRIRGGPLILLPGSFVVVLVHASVDADILNENGSLKVYGQVNGTITTNTGITIIADGANVQQVISPPE